MNVSNMEWIWLNEESVCTVEHLVEVSGLSSDELADLIDNGIIVPNDALTQPRHFQLRYVATAKLARRLRDDFELDRHGLALALTLMRRIEDLQGELDTLRAQLGGSQVRDA